MNRLNLGCGRDIRDGFVNLDRVPLPGVNVVWDVTNLPLPFETGSFDEVLCIDLLEHITEYSALLGEIYRILRPGGVVSIRVPHFTSASSYIDPTHCRLFSVRTFGFFTRGNERNYYFQFAFSEIKGCRITFRKKYIYNYIVELFVNSSPSAQVIYEETLVRIFPAQDIEVILVK